MLEKKDEKKIIEMINKEIEKTLRSLRISPTSRIVDVPTDINAVVNVMYLKNKGIVTSL